MTLRALNLIVLSYGFAFASVMGLCVLFEYLFGADQAQFLVAPFALAIGFSARRVMQKILGYTLEEAMRDGRES